MKESKTILSLEMDGSKVTFEATYIDLSVEDLIYAFNGLLLAHTFQQDSIISAFKDYAKTHKIKKENYED